MTAITDDIEHVMVVVDADGVVLWREGDLRVVQNADRLGFVEGALWTESAVGTGAVTDGIKLALAQKARSLIVQQFETSKDPYGNPWKPSVAKKSKREPTARVKTAGQILRDTNHLMNSFNAVPTAGGFTVSSNVKYAAIHNYGMPGKMPERRIIPDGENLGTWKPALTKVFALALQKLGGAT